MLPCKTNEENKMAVALLTNLYLLPKVGFLPLMYNNIVRLLTVLHSVDIFFDQ